MKTVAPHDWRIGIRGDGGREWIDHFRDCRNITELDRYTVVTLIDRLLIYRDRRSEIIYR